MGRGVGKLLNLLKFNIIALKLCASNLREQLSYYTDDGRGIGEQTNNRKDLEINQKRRCLDRGGVHGVIG